MDEWMHESLMTSLSDILCFEFFAQWNSTGQAASVKDTYNSHKVLEELYKVRQLLWAMFWMGNLLQTDCSKVEKTGKERWGCDRVLWRKWAGDVSEWDPSSD